MYLDPRPASNLHSQETCLIILSGYPGRVMMPSSSVTSPPQAEIRFNLYELNGIYNYNKLLLLNFFKLSTKLSRQ